MKYQELERIFRAHEADRPKYHLDGLITFSDLGTYEDPSNTQRDRTYIVSSNNKAYKPNSLGYSIFGTCLNGTDTGVRLESYMRGPVGWIPGECCLIYYQLLGVNERDILPPELYSSHRQAVEAMLDSLCAHGKLEQAEVLAAYDAGRGHVEDSDFEADNDSAWLNADPSGNWDWKIQPIYVFDVVNIASGTLFSGPDYSEDAAGTGAEQEAQDGGV